MNTNEMLKILAPRDARLVGLLPETLTAPLAELEQRADRECERIVAAEAALLPGRCSSICGAGDGGKIC